MLYETRAGDVATTDVVRITSDDIAKLIVPKPFWEITIPEYSEWRCEIVSGMVIHPLKDKEPNCIHRFFQELILGFKWTKDKDNNDRRNSSLSPSTFT